VQLHVAAGRAALIDGGVADHGLRQLELVDAGLTPTEFRLLVTLARESGRVMTRDELQQRVWGTRHRHRDRTVDVCVRKLREKLDRRSTHTYLQTQYGVGYRFEAIPGAASETS